MPNPEQNSNQPLPKEKWIVDKYAVDWPVAGGTSIFAEDMNKATLDALERSGEVKSIRVTTQAGNLKEGEGQVFPRILTLQGAMTWFINNGYFSYDEKEGVFIPTDKWLARFSKVEWKEEN